MRTRIITTMYLLAGALLVTAGIASAAPQDEQIVANVPFDFVVGTTAMPSGKYVLKTETDNPEVVLVESVDGQHAAFAITIPVSSRRADEPTLTFEKRDNRYVLSRLMRYDGEGLEIASTHPHAESEAAAASSVP